MAVYLRMLLSRGPDNQPPPRIGLTVALNGIWTGGDYYGYGLATYSRRSHPPMLDMGEEVRASNQPS
jgi:hypothetical protein